MRYGVEKQRFFNALYAAQECAAILDRATPSKMREAGNRIARFDDAISITTVIGRRTECFGRERREALFGLRLPLLVIAFALGVAVALHLPWLPARGWLALPSIAAVAVWWRRDALANRPAWMLVLAFAAGLTWTWIHALSIRPTPLAAESIGADLALDGRVVGLPADDGRRARFGFRVDHAWRDRVPVALPRRLLLSWRQPPQGLVPGERWLLYGRLKPPHGMMNPGAWDYERWLFERGIGARGHVLADAPNHRLEPPGWHAPIDRLRLRLREYLRRRFADDHLAGIAVALTIGDRSLLDGTQRELLARTGVSHLIAISGLHIGIVAGLCYFVVAWAWRRSSRLMTRFPAPSAAAIAGLLGGLLYALLSGFAIPARRALSMLAVVAGASLGRRVARPLRSLSLAALVVLALDPFALLSPGFWLSFTAVALILLTLAGKRLSAWSSFARVQLAIGIGLAPLLLLFFGQLSVVAPLVNLISIPLFSFAVIPLLLLSLPGAFVAGAPFDAIAGLAETLLDGAWRLIAWLGDQPWAAWAPSLPDSAWLWPLGAVVVLLLLPRGLPGRALAGAPLLLAVGLPGASDGGLAPGRFVLDVVDIGQGSAVVIRTAHHVLVHDTGPAYPGGRSAAWHSLLPLLRDAGVSRIDRLVLSHDDIDHTGGARLLRARLAIGDVLEGEPVPRYPKPGEPCVAGRRWRWDGVDFEVLWPTAPGFWKGNDASCVIRVAAAGRVVLLTGDIEAAAERQLVHFFAARLRASVVIAPHHGSRSSSSQALVAATRPALVIFTAGYLNRWGFPKADRVARWRAAGARTLTVSDSGAIRILFGAGPPRVECFRARQRRFWHRAAIPVVCGTALTAGSSVE